MTSNISDTLKSIIDKTSAKPSGDGHVGHCPVPGHGKGEGDKTPSLSIGTAPDGTILLNCFAGCTFDAITAALGLKKSDLFPVSSRKNTSPISVDMLAKDKQLPVEFLRELGVSNGANNVQIEYRLANGSLAPRQRFRNARKAKNGFKWNTGKGAVVPYGLWRLEEAQQADYIVLEEGESDAWTLWYHGFPALAVPGATMTTCLSADYFKDIAKIYIVQEPDSAGAKLVKRVATRLRDTGWDGELLVINCSPHKDPNDLHKADPDNFSRSFKKIMEQAEYYQESKLDQTAKELPLPLEREQRESMPFPMEALGPVLSKAARKIQEAIQAPDALCGQSILAAAGLTIQSLVNVELDGRVYPASEFFLTLALSGERKSAVDRVALRKHEAFQKEILNEYKKKLEEWEKSESPQGPPPSYPIFLIEEPSYEGLVKLFYKGSASIGLFSDEGGRLIHGHAMNRDNSVKTASGLSSLWDGKPVTRVRGGDDPIVLFDKRLTCHIMCQPAVAQKLIADNGIIDQGFLSRFLICSPVTTAGTRLYKEINLYESPEIKRYYEKMEELLNVNRESIVNGGSALRIIRLTDKAKQVWIQFHDVIEGRLKPGKDLDHIRSFANKIPEHAIRLSAILQVVDDMGATEIDVDHIKSGIELARFYLNEALRIQSLIISDPQIENAKILLKWLKQKGLKLVPLPVIYQSGPMRFRAAKAARQAMKALEEHGWAERVKGGADIDGKKYKDVWRVNYDENSI